MSSICRASQPPAKFTIEITSLTLANMAGLPGNFDSSLTQEFKILDTGTYGMSGSFAASMFTIVPGGFAYSDPAAAWSIASHDNALWLYYTTMIPEPTTTLLLGLGGLLLLLGRRLQRRSC